MSVNGFSQYTQDLTFEDRGAVRELVTILKECVGKKNSLTNKKLRDKLASRGVFVRDTKIRKLIHHVRVIGLVKQVVASSMGYYIATSREEFLTYIESLAQRERSIAEVRIALQGQMHAPTPIKPKKVEEIEVVGAEVVEPKIVKQRAVAKKESNGWKTIW